MDNVIESIQSGTADSFLTLPFLLIGFAFFFGILTSNIGLILLFFAQILVVPLSSYVLNGKIDTIASFDTLKYILSFLFVGFVIFSDSINANETDGLSITKYVLTPLLFILHKYLQFKSEIKTSSKQCAVIPGLKPDETVYNFPSAWLSHVTFFISFVFSNALLVYNLPEPTLSLSTDQKLNEKRQENLDERVTNRKAITIGVMILSIVIFLALLYFRFTKTPCESGFFKTIPSILLTGFLGSSFVYFLYNSCGINPIDILGIVQGLINPDIIDRPIVCVGDST